MDVALLKPTRPTKKTRYHHGDLRVSIIHAVAALISEKRDLTFQLKEVAALVGTTQPALYKHFASKAALLVETALAGYVLQRRFRDHALARVDESPISQLLAIGHAYIYFSKRHPGFFLLMKALETKEMRSSKRYIRERNRSVSLISGLIRKGMEQGLFEESDPELVMTTVQSSAYGLAHLYITGQVEFVAPHHIDDLKWPGRVLRGSLGAFVSPAGREHMLRIEVDPFAELECAPGAGQAG